MLVTNIFASAETPNLGAEIRQGAWFEEIATSGCDDITRIDGKV
jgi:hypothetical protein